MRLLESTQVDLILTEIRLPAGNGPKLLEQIQQRWPGKPVIVLTAHDDWLYCEQALQSGARGFLGKSERPESIIQSIFHVIEGKIVVSEPIQQGMLERFSTTDMQDPSVGIRQLTTRELQVFEMIGSGMSTRQIASQLELSVKTIDTYREKLKQKLRLDSAAQLNRIAWEWSHVYA